MEGGLLGIPNMRPLVNNVGQELIRRISLVLTEYTRAKGHNRRQQSKAFSVLVPLGCAYHPSDV